ncbi:PP2C family protein-serine/threonine phosphatase [Streptomyces sp. NBC_00102]|uniref:PP2C family protein-serine/threonine phosphatase n=1 Tax=Streptomyces sp. NBC_00102 TaxID=2975652 RepID=UPI0022581BFA|nr:SpoIIE family protein phosphatase [Streptomyces sp. NBC_00102]MCX5401362.1 SpoIIE family protein phosphatase [Streptomyces sp. NBC_00102]
MPSPLFADRPAAQPSERNAVDAMIDRARRLRGDLDSVCRAGGAVDEDDPQARWQRALCELAAHHLDDLGTRLGQLREGPPPPVPDTAPAEEDQGPLSGRAGSAEWNLLNDGVEWSAELYEIFGRDTAAGPLSLDELPTVLIPEDQPLLTSMVTNCLVDGKPLDGEFRIRRPDGRMRTLHAMGEPVLDPEGRTVSLWAVLRDVSALNDSRQLEVRTRDSLHRRDDIARTEQRIAVELHQAVLPAPQDSLGPACGASGAMDVAARLLPSRACGPTGGDWYDAMTLPDGRTLLTVGSLTGRGIPAASSMAMVLGALRGMAVAGIEPRALLTHLNQLLQTSVQPALGSALCGLFDPSSHLLTWAQAGHPAPVLFRAGTGTPLPPAEGVLLGAAPGVAYGQESAWLLPGDVLLLRTDGLAPAADADTPEKLLGLAPRFSRSRTAAECVRTVAEEFGGDERPAEGCVLVARIAG